MNLTIDIGNTRTKIILFENDSPIHEEISSDHLESNLSRIYTRFRPTQCAWCSVRGNDEEIEQAIQTLPCPSKHLTGETDVPINVCYKSRNTLGADRLAAVLGASTLHPQRNLLIIDAGTCVTYDIVDAQGNYLGGNISPGLNMRLKALHQQTARLPLISPSGEIPDFGNNTETAIRSGVINGLTFEIEGYIIQLQKRFTDLKVFLTGGSHFKFSDTLEPTILTDHYLVARGLNRILWP